MSAVLNGIDAGLCLLLVLVALEYLRCVHLFAQPLLSLSFYLLAIGAFSLLLQLLYGCSLSASNSFVPLQSQPSGACSFLAMRQEPR